MDVDHVPAWKRLLSWLGLRRQTLTITAPLHLMQGTFEVTGYSLKFKGDENLSTFYIKGNRLDWGRHERP